MEDSDKSNPQHERFTAALASVLSASPEQIRDSEIQAKSEEPSPHKPESLSLGTALRRDPYRFANGSKQIARVWACGSRLTPTRNSAMS